METASSSAPRGVAASHELLEHTGEVRLRVRADSLAGLFAEAARAVGALELRGATEVGRAEWAEVALVASDPAALLVEWINEIIFRAESECTVPTEFEIRVEASQLSGRIRGVEVARAPGLVKAATYHGVMAREVDTGFEAEVVLDV